MKIKLYQALGHLKTAASVCIHSKLCPRIWLNITSFLSFSNCHSKIVKKPNVDKYLIGIYHYTVPYVNNNWQSLEKTSFKEAD